MVTVFGTKLGYMGPFGEEVSGTALSAKGGSSGGVITGGKIVGIPVS